jgi:hypothetical protein
MCIGAIYMSGVRGVHFAARDPFAGSTDLLGKNPYMSRKPIKVFAPDLPELELVVTAMSVCRELLRGSQAAPAYLAACRERQPQASAFGERLAAGRLPMRWRAEGWEAGPVFDRLIESYLE